MTTTLARPATTAAPLRVAAGVAGLGFLGLALAQLTLPDQVQPFTRASDYLIEYAYAAGLVAAVAATAALHRLHAAAGVRWGRLGAVAAAVFGLGHLSLALAVGATAVRGVHSLDAFFLPGLAGWALGGVLLAVATFRAGLLPRAAAPLFAAALPLTMALGDLGPAVAGGVWLTVAALAPRR